MGQSHDRLFIAEDEIDLADHIIATYRLQVKDNDQGLKLHDALSLLAFDPTIGTWTDSVRTTPGLIDQFAGKVLHPFPREEDHAPLVRIAIPMENLDPQDGGIPQLLGILGVPFTLKAIYQLRLVDLSLPASFIKALPHPRHGVAGVYGRWGLLQQRPILATMLKPRVGLSTEQYVADVREALLGGIDIIFDDEVMGSSSISTVRDRVTAMRQVIAEVQEITGMRKGYAANATTSVARLATFAQELQELGADALYVNPITTGFSALELLRSHPGLELPLLCCRALHGVFTRNRDHGISMYVLLKLARLCGADAMHVGSMKGKRPHAIVGDSSQVKNNVKALQRGLKGTAPALPIVSGGLHPGNLAWTVQELGTDIIIQAGSGVLGHPQGPQAGARALRTVADGICAGRSLLDLAGEHEEVSTAFQAWGYVFNDTVLEYEQESSTEQKEQRRRHLSAQIVRHQANLSKLEQQIAHHGGLMNTPLAIWNDLEDTKRALDEAQTELNHL